MKKGLIFVLFALVSIVSYSQVSWNAKVGMNLSNVTQIDDSKVKAGFQAGVGMEYAFNELWSIQPSLLFTTKGFKLDAAGKTLTANPMYLELPVMAAVRFAVADGQNVVIKAGPYIAYGLGGKYKFAGEKVDFFGDTKVAGVTVVKGADKFDAGLGVGVAYEINRIFIDLTGEIGLTKLYDAEKSPKNMNFSVGVGYKF
ncbi:porin family protein [Bacteroides pyogenes]|uniref:porin family protein n=1 Tax=Bacteroides pyogenes TaxID=310300 RepID=UPI003B42A21D